MKRLRKVFFLGIGTVKAEEVTLREVNAYKGYATKIVGSNSYYGPIHYLYFGNTVAYCLEGSVMITNSNYQKEPFGTYFEENLRKELELISYYGYEYKDHKRLEYYMATQELIWLRLGIDRVIWSTEPLGKGTIFNIEDYKEEIESLVAQHNDMPSFITPTFIPFFSTITFLFPTKLVKFAGIASLGNLAYSVAISFL